jgi:flagellin
VGIRLSTNTASLGVQREIGQVREQRNRSFEKISSGSRITRAADDAAGLSISEKLKAGIRSMQMASRNSNDGISVLQTAEGAINEAQNILIRLKELSIQAGSDVLGEAERSFTNQEFQHLKKEIYNLAHTTKFNGTPLLNGMGETMEFQVGIDGSKAYDRVFYSPNDTNITPASLGIAGAHISDKESAVANLGQIDKAMDRLSMFRSYLGGMQATLSSNVQNMDNHRIHTATTNSRLRDTDMAYESAKQIQNEVIMNGSGAVLAQANNLPKQALKLLDIS